MFFNSLEFALFLVACLAIYAAIPHRAQNRFLLIASYLFYAAWDWRFLGLILTSTVVDYAVGRLLSRHSEPRLRRALLVSSLCVNLGLLGVFKYAGFFVDSFMDLAAAFGFAPARPLVEIVLPVGISFYTFQTLSYTIDVYRRRIECTRNFFDFALFVSFFPQLVAGPIERASGLIPQITRPRRRTPEQFSSGCWLIFWGIFKKAVVADNLALLVDAVYGPEAAPVRAEVLFATLAFAIQIYCDFSGYTDVARGVARLLGFELMLNFRLPYFATSPSDFWRRWHISLSTWLRDYLYIPLGGNRRGAATTTRNLLITMLLGGLWHGARWNFVVWGAYHGLLLVLQRAAQPALARIAPRDWPARAAWWSARVVVTFIAVCVGWMIFRVDSLTQLGQLLAVVVNEPGWGHAGDWWLPFSVLVGPLLGMQIWQLCSGKLEPLARAPLPVRVPVYVSLLVGLVLLGEDYGEPFIYFQF
jgi:D-alanyl-lipoteichoic acid acyltransferase DltB (MBOAT superfamily)